MILVADSGSTKTHWIATDRNRSFEFRSPGINPQIQSNDQITAVFNEHIKHEPWFDEITEVFFYGAGCSASEKCENVRICLQPHFANAKIYVDHDLTAAGRALFGQGTGIACILGTGSNSGIYDGKNISHNIAALGYILGDEGSGAYLGKMLLRDYIYGITPEMYRKQIEEEMGLNKQLIFDKVYKNPSPNVFLASLASYISDNNCDKYFYQLIYNAFKEFTKFHILLYSGYDKMDIGVIGSIAHINQEIFSEVLTEYGLKLKKIIKSPIRDLTEYHLQFMA